MRRARAGLAFAALIAVLVVLGLWLAQSRDSAAGPAAAAAGRAQDARAMPAFDERASVEPSDTEPAAATPLAAPTSGPVATSARLVVHVIRARDQKPAPDVGLLVMNTGALYWYADVIAGRTGADGSWTLDPAPLGLLRVIEDRGNSLEARITAGQTTELLLPVLDGSPVRGVVVDQQDEPVAGAELWLFDNQTSPHGRRVGRTDSAGHFVIEDLRWQFLGARAAGHAPSDLVDLEQLPAGGDAGRLHLRGPGGRVVGRVTDASGQPLSGAMVVVGPNGGFPEELPQRDGPPSFLVRSAVDGSYAVNDVPAGPVPLAAALEGRSPWSSSIELHASESIVVDIVLPPGATIAGTVRDAQGAPVAYASVWIGSSDTVFDRVHAGSDEAGRYELRSLPLGQQRVRASHDQVGQAWRELVVVAGESYAWDPQLGAGGSFLGRVVDERGAAMAELHVFAQHVPRDDQTRMSGTDAEGRFAIDGCDDAEHELDVTARDNDSEVLVKLEGARTGPDELVLVVPDSQRRESSVSGRLVDDLGQPLPSPEVSASAPDPKDPTSGMTFERASAPIDRGTGAFTIKGLQLGDYLGVVASPDWYHATFPITGLQLGEQRDLGTLVFPSPGRLRAELVLPEGVEPDDVEVHVEHLGRIGVFSRPDMPAEAGQPLVRRSGPLDPREDCVLCASGPSVAPRRLTLRPASGRDTIVPLALERGVRVELSFVLGAAKGHFFKLTVLDAGGATVVSAYPEVASTSETTPAVASLSLGLAPGRYALQLRHNRQELRIEDLEVPKDALALPPRVIQVP